MQPFLVPTIDTEAYYEMPYNIASGVLPAEKPRFTVYPETLCP